MTEWRPKEEAKPDGTICQIRIKDIYGGVFESMGRYTLGLDGRWHGLLLGERSPPLIEESAIVSWRPSRPSPKPPIT